MARSRADPAAARTQAIRQPIKAAERVQGLGVPVRRGTFRQREEGSRDAQAECRTKGILIFADRTKLKALALNCSLKGTDASQTSSTDKMIQDLFAALEKHGVSGEVERAADYAIKPGVLTDEGEGDEWPELRSKVLAADIFILGRRSGCGSLPASPSGSSSEWTPSCRRRTTPVACRPAERWPSSPS